MEESIMSSALALASGRLGRVVAFRLPPGADVLQSIAEVAQREGIDSGLILSGAASLNRAVLRNVRTHPPTFPITNEHRSFTPKDGPLELLAISGNIARREDGELVIHGHITISTGDGRAYGGHLVEGAIIFSTGEFTIAELEGMRLERPLDPETRAYELAPRPDEDES
jgi:predicted DNA-binding protein with PD1-like motif